jgi:hydroxymethylpyrimidine pyrophosphatase-like HAD family hydrolase
MEKNPQTPDKKKSGISVLSEILNHSDSCLLTDLDDTVKESQKYLWQDGKKRRVFPETVFALLAIRKSGTRLGIVTEQSFSEIQPFISDVSELATGSKDPYTLFNGLIVGEGGSVVNSKEKGQVILAPKRAIEDKEKIVGWLWKNVISSEIEGWSILRGTDPKEATYVQLPPKEDICVATAGLWEKGPHISEKPEYVVKYKMIEDAVQQGFRELQIESLTTYEAGNGTLRIVPKFINKAHSLELLSAFGMLDLGRTAYSCDGPNDVKLAEKIKSKKGGVIAVGNAVPKLHEIADYSTLLPSGKGFAEAISLIFPNEYLQAQIDLQHLKLA